jgi:2,4-dienoyl-CoA reductase-like NADH-dependent reductase (Old Yellow Enzyme family)
MTTPPSPGRELFPTLLSPVELGPVTLRNRIVSSGHATRLADGREASPRLRAYHRARAAGGAGLIITEASFITEEGSYSPSQLVNIDDSIVPGLRQLAAEIHGEDCRVFGQLLHLGLEQPHSQDGVRVAAPGPSASPSERFHTAGRAMSVGEIASIVSAFGDAAERMATAGFDGVEIAASHGYLIAQFLSTGINERTDRYGGSFENRLRLLREILGEVRSRIGPGLALGIRISGDELTTDGLTNDDVVEVCAAIGGEDLVDYFNIAIGSSRQMAAAVHIVSPMGTDMAISTSFSRAVKEVVSQPVLVVGRINHPALAEEVLASGAADLCGMTRALICDPEMPNKVIRADIDSIRICIACNQACIDRFHRGHGISCIQYPETGRELQYGIRIRTVTARRVMVVGGGPAGMKAAAVAAERGHDVTLFERANVLGGQVLLAELLPRRSEFGGIVPNLTHEMERAGVAVKTGLAVDRALIDELAPEVVIIATGASVRHQVGVVDDADVVDAWQVLRGEVTIGHRVLIADWRCDWIGIGIAEKLATERHQVRLASTGHVAGELLPRYVRDHSLGELHRLGVELIPMTRFYGADEDTVYLQHIASGEPVICEGVDTVVFCQGHIAENSLEATLADFAGEVHVIGDSLAPRTVEEAVLEGLKVASGI